MGGSQAAAGVATVALAALAVAVPAVAAGTGAEVRRRVIGISCGIWGPAAALLAVLAGPGPGLAASMPLAGLALFLAGGTRAARRWGTPPAAAAALAALLGCSLLVLPFLGDPLVESRGPGRASATAVAVLVGGSPLLASAGGGLGVDVLRTPRAYGGREGPGLSRIGPYFAHSVPGPWASAAALGGVGALLLLVSVLPPVARRS